MRETESTAPGAAAVFEDVPMAFAAFALTHAACGDRVLELRLGERCLLEWCTDCAEMRAFISSGKRSAGATAPRTRPAS